MTKQEADQAKQKEIYDFQKETPFDSRERPLEWSTRMKSAMLNVSIPTLAQFGAKGITADQFGDLVSSIDKTPTIWQMGLLLRIASQANAKELGITEMPNFVVFQQAVSRISAEWSDLNTKKYEKIDQKYNKMIVPEPEEEKGGNVVTFPAASVD